ESGEEKTAYFYATYNYTDDGYVIIPGTFLSELQGTTAFSRIEDRFVSFLSPSGIRIGYFSKPTEETAPSSIRVITDDEINDYQLDGHIAKRIIGVNDEGVILAILENTATSTTFPALVSSEGIESLEPIFDSFAAYSVSSFSNCGHITGMVEPEEGGPYGYIVAPSECTLIK
ncbi:MAG: hypothetical protein KDD62_12270, partial [Bdellovibrionales bacterium]|nr:hypothetical protein [Bdellovibrionales bacterium]